MSIENLHTEADLKRWLEGQAQTPGVLPATTLPFRNLKYGFATCTYGGSSIEATQIITHGLGAGPTFAVIMPEDAGYVGGVAEYTPTTFLAKVQTRDGATPGATTIAPFQWLAIC